MLLFLSMLALAADPPVSDEIPMVAEEIMRHKDILVAPPTVDDKILEQYIPYLTSIVVAQASTDSHWVKRSSRGDSVSII